jgi:hypothetical protein
VQPLRVKGVRVRTIMQYEQLLTPEGPICWHVEQPTLTDHTRFIWARDVTYMQQCGRAQRAPVQGDPDRPWGVTPAEWAIHKLKAGVSVSFIEFTGGDLLWPRTQVGN